MLSVRQSGWFVRKVIFWRAAASTAWSVLLLPFTTTVFLILSRISIYHPVQWITECLCLSSASVILSLLFLITVVIIVGFLNLEYYTVIPTIACSKIALLGQLLHPQQLFNTFMHCIMGLGVALCCAFIIGGRYETLLCSCQQNDDSGPTKMCLNEYHLFLMLSGFFLGLSHSLLGVIHNVNYVTFHPIQQYKYPRFTGSICRLVKCSCFESLYSLRNFIVVYFFLGHIPRSWICQTLNLEVDRSAHALDTVGGLLDLSLLYHTWISGTFLLFTWYTTLQLFRIFVTEWYSFPVQSTFSCDDLKCLPKAIEEKQPMILKFLALQDLALLSQHSPLRRAEIFALSQPGGRPRNWNAVSKECLSLLADLTQRLVTYHDCVATNGRAKSLSTGSETKSSSGTSVISGEDPFSPSPTALLKTPASVFTRSITGGPYSPLTAPFTPDLDSPFSPALRRLAAPVEQCSPWHGAVQSPHILRRGPKLWSTSTDSKTGGSPSPSPAPVPSPKQEPSKPRPLAQFLQNRRDQVVTFIGITSINAQNLVPEVNNCHANGTIPEGQHKVPEMPPLAPEATLGTLLVPEASSQALFADTQAHIWALEGLSCLVQASFTEDHFGVVQTTLPSILSSMLVLQEAVDRHFKLPHASSKPVRCSSMGDGSYKTLRFSLRATLKTALYRITTTFGEHLNAVELSTEHRRKLQNFLEYKV